LLSRVVAAGLPTSPSPGPPRCSLSGAIFSRPVDFALCGGVPRAIVFIRSFGRQAHRIPTNSLGGDGIWRPTRGCMEPTRRLSLARQQPLCRDFGAGKFTNDLVKSVRILTWPTTTRTPSRLPAMQ
jgi:hypothetical protein